MPETVTGLFLGLSVTPILGLATLSPSPTWTQGPFVVTAQSCKDRELLQRPESLGPTLPSTVITVSLTHQGPVDHCPALLRQDRSGLSSGNHFRAVKATPDIPAHPDLPDRHQTLPDPGRCLVVLAPDLIHTATPEHRPPPHSPENTGVVLIGGG